MRGLCTEKIGYLSQLGAEKIAFPPKLDGQTDGYTMIHRRTDITVIYS